MNKQEFLAELEHLLRNVDPAESQEMLYDYEEHIRSAVENGETEEQAVANLGNPRVIAKELLATAYVQQAETSTSVHSVLRAVLAVIGLGFFNLVIVLGPFIALAGILIAFYAVSFSFIIAPVAALIGLSTGLAHLGIMDPWAATFVFIFLEGLGWLLMVGTTVMTKGLGKLSVGYLKLNLRVIKGGR